MKEYRAGFISAGCFLLVCVLFGYLGWREYTRISRGPLPDPIRLERGVFRAADVILEGEISDQAIVRLGSYSEFEAFAKKYGEHPIVVARVTKRDRSAVIVQYLLPDKRYYFSEEIERPWGWSYGFDRLTFDGSNIVLHSHRSAKVEIYLIAALVFFVLSLCVFPWRVFLLLRPATT